MSVEMMQDSAQTWLENPVDHHELPAVLTQDKFTGLADWLAGFRRRFVLRGERAEQTYQASRNPENGLPVAENPAVWRFLLALFKTRKVLIAFLLISIMASSICALIVPRMLGGLVDKARSLSESALLATIGTVAGVVILHTALTYLSRFLAAHFGQGILADARESVIRTVLRLPVSRVESASTGDLVTRVTRDVGRMSESANWALPELLIAAVMAVFTMVALFLNSPLLTIPAVLMWLILIEGGIRYLRRAQAGYVAEGATYSAINSTLTETVEGARTVESLGLQQERIDQSMSDQEASGQAERYTLMLRNILFATTDFVFYGPLVLIMILGAWGYGQGWVSLGQIAAAVLYTQTLAGPMDALIMTADHLQMGVASTTRLLGIASVPPDRTASDDQPQDSHLVGQDLRFAYRKDHDVLHGVSLDLRPGERLAIVGPSGSGKSTLGRLLSGINGPRTGSVTVGGVELMKLPLETLRTEVALVTQEHHVFVGSLRDNIVLARETALTGAERDVAVEQALRAVDAWEWVERLPNGLATELGSGNYQLTPAQAQQVALARLVIADPHTLVLDEATSLIDPKTARHLEGSMANLMHGRTVVAIAHRLHTAHDADRIAVVIDGKIAELGSHHELLAQGGEYAALWQAWTT